MLDVMILAFILSCAATLASGEKAAMSPPASLELRIPTRVASVKQTQFEIALVNRSSRVLWVNSRLALNYMETPPGLNEVWLEIKGPSGEAVDYNCKGGFRLATPADYELLKSGESISRRRELRCFSDLKAGVAYTARAHYHDRNPDVPAAPDGGPAQHLSEEIVSTPVQFEVAGP
jgi:hypothetical protein